MPAMPKITMPPRTFSSDSDSIRKRVGKACDRCRLKKSKCDGSSPCLRCKADNAICVFGERKKSHDKVYPKGYVEMLEQQQSQLVAGLQETYRRLWDAQLWPGSKLTEHNGNPLTHDILAGLDLLELKQDGSGENETFEEDCQKLQQRLVSEGAPYVARRGSFSSISDCEHHDSRLQTRTTSQTSIRTSSVSSLAQPMFNERWNFQPSPPPITLSPPPKMKMAQQGIKPSPLSNNLRNEEFKPIIRNDSYMDGSWITVSDCNTQPDNCLPLQQLASQGPVAQENVQAMETLTHSVEPTLESDATSVFGQQFDPTSQFGMFNPQDWMINDSMDVDFGKFIQVGS